jgi:hypothetical protein
MVEGTGILFIMDYCLKKAHQKYIEGTLRWVFALILAELG